MKPLARARAHVQRLWPRHALLPIAPFVGYAAWRAWRHELRVEHVGILAIAAALAYTGPRTKELFRGLLPLGLVGLVYDGMRPFQRVGLTPSRVHVCDVRGLESALFGWRDGDEARTLHDFFLVHHARALDLLCAVPYATFLLVCVACAIWLYVKDRAAMVRFAWGFFCLNVLGFATYHLIPAAPPWYFHANGCAVDLAARATCGPALARVDATLGVPFFHGMYSEASSVFGALPSLHCAYPLLVVIEGWRSFGRGLRIASVAFWLLMIFAAVYLDHHWVLDAVLGDVYAVLVAIAVRAVTAPRAEPLPARLASVGSAP